MLCLLVCACSGGSRSVGSNDTTAVTTTDTNTQTSDSAIAPVASQSEREGWYRRSGAKVREGDRAVELARAVDETGNRVTLASLPAPVVVVTFGASWCDPCEKELPALDQLARTFDPAAVSFVAVNIDSTLDKGKRFMQRFGFERVRALYDPKQTSVGSYDPPTMPTLFIVNRGIVKHVHAGFRSGDESAIQKAIERELE